MVNADTSRHELGQELDLWKVSVDLVQPLYFLLDELLDEPLGVAVSKVCRLVKLFSILDCPCSAECKHYARQKTLTLDRPRSSTSIQTSSALN